LACSGKSFGLLTVRVKEKARASWLAVCKQAHPYEQAYMMMVKILSAGSLLAVIQGNGCLNHNLQKRAMLFN